jgi:hypothetical protein
MDDRIQRILDQLDAELKRVHLSEYRVTDLRIQENYEHDIARIFARCESDYPDIVEHEGYRHLQNVWEKRLRSFSSFPLAPTAPRSWLNGDGYLSRQDAKEIAARHTGSARVSEVTRRIPGIFSSREVSLGYDVTVETKDGMGNRIIHRLVSKK